tara:strand:- start:129 stop:1754 length:1626 start_codon:yes stop_codon:yes gene_type:complete
VAKLSMFKKGWHKNKYINFVKDIIFPKFLIELIMPKDIFSFLNSLKIQKTEEQVYRFILACSVFNAVLIGMPDGVGVLVLLAQAVEVIMAFRIAQLVGLIEVTAIFSIKKLTKLVTGLALTSITVIYGFKFVLNAIFKTVANLTVGIAFPAVAFSTFATTLFYGLFLYLVFDEIKNFESIKKLSFLSISRITKNSYRYTINILKSSRKYLFVDFPNLSKSIYKNIKDAFNVNQNVKGQIKGEFFFAGSLAYLMSGKFDYLSGPFGKIYIDAWKKAFPSQLGDEATHDQIRDLANSYDAESLDKVLQNVNSKFFEILQVYRENADGDEWSAELSDSQNQEGYDAILRNSLTGETVKINYKYTSDFNYIERHVQEYPDIPVIAPKEIQEKINSPFVSHVDSETLQEVTSENFEKLLNQYSNLDLVIGTTTVGAASYITRITPFIFAYYKNKITREEFGIAIKKFFPDIASRTINRIGMLTFFGPLYGLFILSSFAMRGTMYGFNDEPKKETDTNDEPKPKEEGFFEKKFSRRSFFTLSYLKNF